MENKCNKTPNNKYLDHVYCHTSESKNYIRANNASGNGGGTGGTVAAGQDIMALLKENKQLKAMLILHLDLIQEQSDQLMAKDKVLNGLREETENLKCRNSQLESQVQELQKQLQRQMKRAIAVGEVSTLPPPPLAKIQCKLETDNNVQSTRPTDENKFEKEDTIVKESEKSKSIKKNYKIQEITKSNEKPTTKSNIIGECNGKLISKIILHRVNTSGLRSPVSTASDSTSELDDSTRKVNSAKENSANTTTGDELEDDDEEDGTEDSNDGSSKSKRKKNKSALSLTIGRGAKPRKQMASIMVPNPTTVPPVKVCITPPTPSRGGKQMPLMLSHAPEMHSDESASCDSMGEPEQRSSSVTSPVPILSPTKLKSQSQTLAPPQHTHMHHHAKTRRCGHISTSQLYCTREWEDEEFICENEFMKEDVNALQADAPMLEIPKWTEHEIAVSYCIEGTEDLSDETFLKRHAKLEVDEKRRKKWDVQQIREQRRIEKLKRRHCKDELQIIQEHQPMASFYPQPDAIQTICFVTDLPVQAFGEVIPKLSTNCHFSLSWLESNIENSSSMGSPSVATLSSGYLNTSPAQAQQQMFNSSFVFMKKRRRQQSSSVAPTTRQRQAIAATAAKVMGTVSTSLLASTFAANLSSTETPKN